VIQIPNHGLRLEGSGTLTLQVFQCLNYCLFYISQY